MRQRPGLQGAWGLQVAAGFCHVLWAAQMWESGGEGSVLSEWLGYVSPEPHPQGLCQTPYGGLWAPCCLHPSPKPLEETPVLVLMAVRGAREPQSFVPSAVGDEEAPSSAPKRLRSPSPVSDAVPPCQRTPSLQARPSSQAAGLCPPPSLSSTLSVMPALNIPTCSALTHLKTTTEKGPFVTPLLSSVAALLPLQKLLLKKIHHPPIFTSSAHILNPLRPPLLFISVKE